MISPATSPWPASKITPFLDYLITECGLAANTIAAYKRDLARWTKFCLNTQITDPNQLTPPLLQKYAIFLAQQKLATPSIARHLVSLKMFLRYHLLVGLTQHDVCSVLETPKIWQRLPSILSQKHTFDLIEAVNPQNPLYLRNRALLELLYATGIRASEAAHLDLRDLNLQIGYVRCLGKGQKERVIPIHKTALKVLQEYLEVLRPQLVKEKPAPNLFLSRTGRTLSRIEIWRIVKKAAQLAGLTGRVTPHTLRHCFGSHLLQGGVDLRVLQDMLGHADVTTTQIYTHVDYKRLREVHKKYHPRA